MKTLNGLMKRIDSKMGKMESAKLIKDKDELKVVRMKKQINKEKSEMTVEQIQLMLEKYKFYQESWNQKIISENNPN